MTAIDHGRRFSSRPQEERRSTEGAGMKRLVVVAASVAMLVGSGASAAFAGEVKGPPNQLNNTNETGALAHANSACAASGLERLRLGRPGTDGVAGADCGGLVEVLRASEGCRGQARTVQGRNRAEVRIALAPAFGRGPSCLAPGPHVNTCSDAPVVPFLTRHDDDSAGAWWAAAAEYPDGARHRRGTAMQLALGRLRRRGGGTGDRLGASAPRLVRRPGAGARRQRAEKRLESGR